jgi:hypothetical protein
VKIARIGGWVACLGVTLTAACACVAAGGLTAPPDAGRSASPGASAPAVTSLLPAPGSSGYCGEGNEFVEYLPYTIAGIYVAGQFEFMGEGPTEDVAARTTVVVATVADVEPGVFNTAFGTGYDNPSERASGFSGPYADSQVVTPVDLVVDLVIHGEAVSGPLRVVVEGGTAGCYRVTVDDAPTVEPGGRYVLFMSPAGEAAGENGRGPALILFAWPVDAGDVVQTVGGPMPLASLIEVIDRVTTADPASELPTPTP